MSSSTVLFIYYLQQFENGPKWHWNRITLAGMAVLIGVPSDYRPKIFSQRVFLYIWCFRLSFIHHCYIVGCYEGGNESNLRKTSEIHKTNR